MKKLVMTVAVLTCAASFVSAQTVTSANIVGYNKAISYKGQQLFGANFQIADGATPNSLFGEMFPNGTKVYKYSNDGLGTAGYDFATFTVHPVFGSNWDKPDMTLDGVGFWVQIPGTAPTNEYQSIISGEVEVSGAVTNPIVIGLQLLTNPYPVDRTVAGATDGMGFTPSDGDKVFVYANDGQGTVGYDFATFSVHPVFGANWDKPNIAISIGAGFWYDSTASTNWIANRPFSID